MPLVARNAAMLTRQCLADGGGAWISAPERKNYVLNKTGHTKKDAAYLPHMCDTMPGLTKRKAALFNWEPRGAGCSEMPGAKVTADVLAHHFCDKFAGKTVLIVGESINAQLVFSFAHTLGTPRFSYPVCDGSRVRRDTRSRVGVEGGKVFGYDMRLLRALSYSSLVSVEACEGPRAPVTIRFIKAFDLNFSYGLVPGRPTTDAELEDAACAEAQGGWAGSSRSMFNLPWATAATQADFIFLSRSGYPTGAIPHGVEAATRANLEFLSQLPRQPRVIMRSSSFGIADCWTKPDPLPQPFVYDLKDPAVAKSRAVTVLHYHEAPEVMEVEKRVFADAPPHIAYMNLHPATAMRPKGHHKSRHDCMHWCLPGPPDEWTRLSLAWWLQVGASATSASAMQDSMSSGLSRKTRNAAPKRPVVAAHAAKAKPKA